MNVVRRRDRGRVYIYISEDEAMMFYLKVLGRNSQAGIDTHKTIS
jgi:hypothetical protein